MQNLTQTLNINVVNTPSVPNAGGITSPGFLSPTVVALSILSFALLLLIAVRILTRNNKTTTKRTIHKATTISLMLLPLLTIPTIAILSNNLNPLNTQATSNLSSVTPAIDINIYKPKDSNNSPTNQTKPLTKTATSTTTVTTDNYSGYTLSAKLNQTPASDTTNNITLTLNNEKLTENSINIYTNETNTSPSTQDHTIAVTVPQDIQSGTYKYNITYDVVDNPSTTMQSMTKAKCDALTLNETITLRDARDNQEYRMRKLADNNCWMIDNLKLELEQGMTLTPATTNLKTGTEVTVDFAWDNFTSGTRDTTGKFVTSGRLTKIGSSATGTDHDEYNAWRQANPNTTNECQNNIGDSGNSGLSYNTNSKTKCGYLYNFYTAAASTALNTQTSGTANGSICPANWKLPSGLFGPRDKTNDFAKLDLAYNGGTGVDHNLSSPDTQNLWLSTGAWQGALSGGYYSNLFGQGRYGTYWSSSVGPAGVTYGTNFDSGSVYPGTDNGDRANGFAIRCLVG
ncbi:MAG: fibrobacter succinogenes major paralogous domain-containing protein [Candidatus Nomurabacteria bacterium]|jgi:hypothetical protein|nr:fibrobacter succinogenes major paralogous domain-containing protein [Candidatus Nomurabacteria bacterium]